MKNRHFTRAIMFIGLYHRALEQYGESIHNLNLPKQVFAESMNLIPTVEVSKWLSAMETLSDDPDIVIKMIKEVDIMKLGSIGPWFFSGNDLSTTIRRINTGLGCMQSGSYLVGEQVGPILKWNYENPAIEAHAKVHDSIRIAVFMVKVLRRYLGLSYRPSRVMLPGYRKNEAIYRDFFNCDIGWNHNKTEIWLNAEERFTQSHVSIEEKAPLAMSFSDLDDLLNMPDPEDEIKVIYETITYSRHLGLPNVDNVAGLLGLSNQQFTRRLHSLGINFTNISNYVLSNLAVNLFRRGFSIEHVARNLGYNHVASFNRMFKKQRGLTPMQYLERQG